MEIHRLNQLFTETKRIVGHQREKEILRGEKFNVFSILGMERAENKTHSAVLCELLNPGGTHLRDHIFLELFIEMVRRKIENVDPEKKTELCFDLQSAKAKTEHSIGKRDDKEKTGGRVDIYLWDKNGNTICIENKIDADDQNAQIERYCNHNKRKNTVFYLTKYGVPATDKSKGNLVEDQDYFLLSYKEDITRWLQLCLEKSAEFPLIRENIKQYMLLIKKLTKTMNNKEQGELFDAILNHHEEASIIASNFKSAVVQLNRSVRQKVFEQLTKKLSTNYNLFIGSDVDKSYSQIWIKIKGKEECKIFFGIQSFSFQTDDFRERLFLGIFVFEGKYLPEYSELGEKASNWWSGIEEINDFEGYKVCLQDSETIKKLNSDSEFQERFVKHIVAETEEYLKKNIGSVSKFLNNV